jgi:outer membrane protein assembly factor BamB
MHRTKLFSLALVVSLALLARGGDWPQILGPARDGVAVGETLDDKWPDSGPAEVWQRDVGAGLAGVAVVGERVYLFHRVGDEEVLECLAAADGAPQWRTPFPTSYAGGAHNDQGPRCVPVVAGERVFLFGAAGDLHCVGAKDGKEFWSRPLNEEFGVRDGYFGVGSSPIVIGDRLLVNVGADQQGVGLAAFAVADGKLLWKGTNEAASYSSPVVANVAGQTRAIFVTRLNVVAVAPESGEIAFQFPFGKRGPTVNAATPLVLDDVLFVSASYGVGAVAATLERKQAKPLWKRDDVMSSQYVTCIHHDGMLYGVDGRQDVGVARLRCFDPRTGEVKWTVDGFGVAALTLAGDKAMALKTDGKLVLFRPNAEEYAPLAEAQLFDDTVQALPALSNGKLFARDTAKLKCFRVGAGKR